MTTKKLRAFAFIFAAGMLCISMSVLLLGCSTESEGSSSENIAEDLQEEQESIETLATIDSTRYDYSEGLAWVSFREADENWLGVMDKAGKVLFRFPHGSSSNTAVYYPTNYENGYSYLYEAIRVGSYDKDLTTCWVLDGQGKVRGYYEDIIAYGGGYLVQERYSDGFESESYSYDILDADGNVLETFVSEGEAASERTKVRYCGQGVFEFVPFAASAPYLYFAESDAYYTNESLDAGYVEFLEDETITPAFIEYEESSDRDAMYYGWSVVLIDSAGVTSKVDCSATGVRWNDVRGLSVSDGVLLVSGEYMGEQSVFLCDLKSGTFCQMPDKYAGKINFDLGSLRFNDGRMVVHMEGADGNTYVGVFDKDWNAILEPTEMGSHAFSFSDGVFIAQTATESGTSSAKYDFYNVNCDVVFTLDLSNTEMTMGNALGGKSIQDADLSSSDLMRFRDGALCINQCDAPYYIDTEGNRLFTKLDTDSVIEVDLS